MINFPSIFPQLTTANFLLRQLIEQDDNEIFLLRSNGQVNKYLEREKAKEIEDARAFIQKIRKSFASKEGLYWAICKKNESNLMGTICLWNFDLQNCKAEIGYELLPQFQKQGIMQEAFKSIINYAFSILNFNKIEAWTVEKNINSIKILERNNFTRDAQLENKINDPGSGIINVIYSLSNQ